MLDGLKVTIIAVGKARRGPEQALYEHYCKRLPLPLTLREVEAGRKSSVDQNKIAEADLMRAALPKAAKVIALDERGKAMASKDFARQLSHWRADGEREVAFLIGGADGLEEGLRRQAHLTLSFGAATWPHLLVRALLAEQLYRAHTIVSGHPYHRE